jgi:uncharacterized protein YbaP (TraB family)
MRARRGAADTLAAAAAFGPGERRFPISALPMLLSFARQAWLIVAAALALQGSPAAAQAQRAADYGFLWEATRGAERVRLFGAMHVGRPAAAATYGADRPLLRDVQVIAFEANVFDAQASLAATQRWAMYPEGAPGLDAHVDAALLARIEKLLARSGSGLAACCRMKPWMLANTLVILESMQAGLNPAYGSEAQLYQAALASGRPVVEIESLDEQLRLFDEAPLSVQLDYLRHTVETIEDGRGRAEIEQLVSAWERGDAATLERQLGQMARSDRGAQRFVAERVIRGRHPKMLDAIERFAASGRLHLVVIGALHYVGPDGLLQMLRERGFSVKRLP